MNTSQIFEIFQQLNFETITHEVFLVTTLVTAFTLFLSILVTTIILDVLGFDRLSNSIFEKFSSKIGFIGFLITSFIVASMIHCYIYCENQKIMESNEQKMLVFENQLSPEQKMVLNAEMNYLANKRKTGNGNYSHGYLSNHFDRFNEFEKLSEEQIKERNDKIYYNSSELIYFMLNGGGELLIQDLKENVKKAKGQQIEKDSDCLMICSVK